MGLSWEVVQLGGVILGAIPAEGKNGYLLDQSPYRQIERNCFIRANPGAQHLLVHGIDLRQELFRPDMRRPAEPPHIPGRVDHLSLSNPWERNMVERLHVRELAEKPLDILRTDRFASPVTLLHEPIVEPH